MLLNSFFSKIGDIYKLLGKM